MTNKIRIGVDAMGGDNSPKKILEGIEISLKKSNDNFFLLFGKKEILEKELVNFSSIKKYCEIIDSPNYISDDESPLTAAKKGKDTSMWMSIDSQKKKYYGYFFVSWKHWCFVSSFKINTKYYCWY